MDYEYEGNYDRERKGYERQVKIRDGLIVDDSVAGENRVKVDENYARKTNEVFRGVLSCCG